MAVPAKSTRGVPASLTDEIRREHEACEAAAESAVKHGLRCGELLIEAKAKVAHGEWMPYLKENFPRTPQTAAAYMRLARNRGQIESASSIRAALKELAAPKAEPSGDRAEVLEQAEAILGDVDLDALPKMPPHEQWDLEEEMAALRTRIRDALTPLERYWLKHSGIVPTAEQVEAIEETCAIAGVMPMIEDLTDVDGAISYVWVGYVAADMDAARSADNYRELADAIENPLTYHPGWARFCRDRLGDGVKFATADLMPDDRSVA